MLRFNCFVIQLRLVRTLIGTLRVHYSYRSLRLHRVPTVSNIQGVETVIVLVSSRAGSKVTSVWYRQKSALIVCNPFSMSRFIEIGELIMLASLQIVACLLKHRADRQLFDENCTLFPKIKMWH